MDDFKTVLNYAHGHKLLAIVAAVHHKTVRKTFNDRTLCLPKSLGLVTASRVRRVLRILVFYGNVILQQRNSTSHYRGMYQVRPANIVKWKIGRKFFIQTKNRKQYEKSVILNIAYPVMPPYCLAKSSGSKHPAAEVSFATIPWLTL